MAIDVTFREALELTSDNSILTRAAARWPQECNFQWAYEIALDQNNTVIVTRAQFARLSPLRRGVPADLDLMDELQPIFGQIPGEIQSRQSHPPFGPPLHVPIAEDLHDPCKKNVDY